MRCRTVPPVLALRGGTPDSPSPGRERGALTEIITLARRLHDDVRSISRPDGGNPSLSDELAHAQRVLAASGVEVRTVLPPWAGPDPAAVGCLRFALREAVGNVSSTAGPPRARSSCARTAGRSGSPSATTGSPGKRPAPSPPGGTAQGWRG
ncbi:hypothetical protein [Streptomyces sp. NPDC017524]|uniref:hypothetical protein n=1 Tax=Streptomyces sp. NPDC017524 TaxID=3364999 RepID=UPI00378BC4CB